MLGEAPESNVVSFDKLPIAHKVAAFRHTLSQTTGQDIKQVRLRAKPPSTDGPPYTHEAYFVGHTDEIWT